MMPHLSGLLFLILLSPAFARISMAPSMQEMIARVTDDTPSKGRS